MDNQYGIGVNNRYELFLGGEDDSVDILRSRAATKEPKKKSKVAEKENKPIQPESKSKTSSGAREGIKETQNLKNVPKKTDAAKTGPKPKVENAKPKPESDVKKPKFDSAKPAPRASDSREERNNRRNREDRPERNNQSFNFRKDRDSHNDASDSKPERIERFGDRFGESSDRPERPERRERPDRFGDRFGESRVERSDRGRGDRGDRGDRPYRSDRSDRFDRFDSNKDGEPGNEGEGGRGRGRGMGRGRGRGRGGFEGRGGRRDFDRQSRSDRTGVKPVDKREGGGSHNWGTHRDELDDTVNNSLNESNDWNGGNPEDNTNASEQTGKRNKDDAEPTTNGDAQQEPVEPKELTLEEWKALKGPREKPQYNIRKAGEGEDLTQYKNMVVLQKKSDNAVKPSIEAEHHDEPAHNKQSSKKQNIVDINLHFSDNRTMRGRGGRGGGRGRRGAGDDSKFHQNREPKAPKQSAPKVDDEHDFPSLG